MFIRKTTLTNTILMYSLFWMYKDDSFVGTIIIIEHQVLAILADVVISWHDVSCNLQCSASYILMWTALEMFSDLFCSQFFI